MCGVTLFIGTSFQQMGIVYTTAGKSGFITAFYMVLVPLLSVFLGKRIRPIIWLCVAMSLTGLAMLTMKDGFSIGKGEWLTLLSAFGYALQILAIARWSPVLDGVRLSSLQFLWAGVFSIPFMLLTETIHPPAIAACWLPLLYSGVLTCGIAFTFQVIAQRYTEPTVASLIMCLESVFSAIFGALILHELLAPRELAGCAIMFAAILLSQIPERPRRSADKSGGK